MTDDEKQEYFELENKRQRNELDQADEQRLQDLEDKAYGKDRSRSNGVFEPNPKHGSENRGRANKEPSNPQEMLDNSYELPGNTTRRVAADPSTGEFAVFDEHRPGKFHGHVRGYEELNQSMRNVLLKNKVINRKGKILK
ncbi:hypothetical protein C900_05779 [Fulvivirga imtechensis AK7]|uniref:Uncharacterized protein n=1 Tax=Fulvivirga imtechensis AK7 TaxID=1237149 RepID=L8JKU6_9BACT|nr:hypothetical protein [Fulvivirga imtechensis]ELR68833.1 hypothetical protein C900_05779 [Fulvivirga imtechensis AK7]